MKIAAVEAIAALAREAPSEVAARAYGGEAPTFGPGSLIPNPFDPRLILRIAPALAEAAMKTGVATRPIADIEPYRDASTNRVPLRPHHEAAVRPGQSRPQTRGLCGRRGRTRAARHPGRGGTRLGAADPDRPAGGDRGTAQEVRPRGPARARFRAHQSGRRPALSPICRSLCGGSRPPRRDSRTPPAP